MFKVDNSVREATTKARAKGDAPGPRDKHLWTMTNIPLLVFGHKINNCCRNGVLRAATERVVRE